MATTTPNFGWPVPTSTDLVKDGATAIEALGDGIDTSMVDLKGGTTGQLLAKASGTDMDFTWTSPNPGDITAVTATSPLTGGGTSGDVTIGILSGTTSNLGAVQLSTSVSSTSTTLAATASAVKTAYDLANNGGPTFRAIRTTTQSVTQNTFTKIQLDSETFDTDSCFDSTTNYRFTPTKSGYYQMNAKIRTTGTNVFYGIFYKNGSDYSRFVENAVLGEGYAGSDIIFLNGTTDYVELYIYSTGVGSSVDGGSNTTFMSGTWIRS
jgi:hypothetical protein